MRKYFLLTAMVLAAVGVGSAIKALTLAPSAPQPPPTVIISPEEIQQQIDVKLLPVREVKEPF